MTNATNGKAYKRIEIMEGNLKEMTDRELGQVIETLLYCYIPNMVAMCSHPADIMVFRQRLVAAMAELTLRQERECAKLSEITRFA